MSPNPDAIAAALQAHTHRDDFVLPGPPKRIQAATLIPLRWAPQLQVIATVRSAQLRHHPGEVCFPGGRPAGPDESLLQTAEREAEEELGIRGARVLGRLSQVPVYTSSHRITPWVAAIGNAPLQPEPAEVAQVLPIDLEPWLQTESIEGLPFPMPDGIHWSPVFRVDGHTIFGATAHTLLELLDVLAPLYGLQRPPLVRGSTEWADILPAQWAERLPG